MARPSGKNGEYERALPPTLLALGMAAVLIVVGAVGGAIWMQLRVPPQLCAVLAEAGGGSGTQFGENDVAALVRYVQKCSSAGFPDVPLTRIQKIIGERSSVAAVEANQEVEAELAREAHEAVLRQNGGEWGSKFHRLRIDRIVDGLSHVAGDDASGYKIAMLDTPQINAFSTADGRIYLTRGLVTTSSDDEIALVIAHEMHHIRSGHWINWWALSAGDGSFDADTENPQEGGAMAEAALALVKMGAKAFSCEASTSYEQEYEADAMAILHAAECGYCVRRIFRILTRLPEMPVTSHPTSSDRIEGASEVLESMGDPSWIAVHNPAEVARLALENAIAALRGDRPGICAQVVGLDEVASICARTLKTLEGVEDEMRAYNWLGHGWPYADDSRMVVRTALFTPVLCAVDVGVETTLGHSSAGTPGVLGGRLWLVRRDGVWVVVLGQAFSKARPVSSHWSMVGDELGNAWRWVGRGGWLASGSSAQVVWDGNNGDAGAARGVLEAAARWRDTSIIDFGEHLSTYAKGRIEYVNNANLEDEGGASKDTGAFAGGSPGCDCKHSTASVDGVHDRMNSGAWQGDQEDGSLEAMGWAQFLSGRKAQNWAWSVRCDVHSRTLATVTFSSAISLDEVPITSNFTRLTMVLEDGEWKVASVSLQ